MIPVQLFLWIFNLFSLKFVTNYVLNKSGVWLVVLGLCIFSGTTSTGLRKLILTNILDVGNPFFFISNIFKSEYEGLSAAR